MTTKPSTFEGLVPTERGRVILGFLRDVRDMAFYAGTMAAAGGMLVYAATR